MTPNNIQLHKQSGTLELSYQNGENYQLSAEFLRVHSPSAEVRGHGVGQEVLQSGKQDVKISNVESRGHYAICIIFDDGHDSGIYEWQYLYKMATEQEAMWQSYLSKLEQAGLTRISNNISFKSL